MLGMMFHSSSLIYFPMYFILNIKWNRKFILGLFVLGNIYYVSNARLIINGVRMFGSYLPGGIGQKIVGYLSIIPGDFPFPRGPARKKRLSARARQDGNRRTGSCRRDERGAALLGPGTVRAARQGAREGACSARALPLRQRPRGR